MTCELSIVTSIFFGSHSFPLPPSHGEAKFSDMRALVENILYFSVFCGAGVFSFLLLTALCEDSGREFFFFPLRNTFYEIIRQH